MPDAGRVITGLAKGVRLAAPGPGTRPLSDRVKQTLFAALESALGEDWPGPFLDLYAGSGAAGIEALSRGAPRAVFVERDVRAAAVIRENLRRTGLAGGEVMVRPVGTVLAAGASALDGPFTAVVVDPPYADADALGGALAALGAEGAGWIVADGVVVVKHFWRTGPPETAGALQLERTRRFGETALTYYRRR